MKKITNPWSGMEGYRCFGCDPHSERGLRMEFYEDGDEIVSVWHPRPEFQGVGRYAARRHPGDAGR